MLAVRILPHVRTDQVMKMVRDTGQDVRIINGHPCLVPHALVVMSDQTRRVVRLHEPTPPDAA